MQRICVHRVNDVGNLLPIWRDQDLTRMATIHQLAWLTSWRRIMIHLKLGNPQFAVALIDQETTSHGGCISIWRWRHWSWCRWNDRHRHPFRIIDRRILGPTWHPALVGINPWRAFNLPPTSRRILALNTSALILQHEANPIIVDARPATHIQVHQHRNNSSIGRSNCHIVLHIRIRITGQRSCGGNTTGNAILDRECGRRLHSRGWGWGQRYGRLYGTRKSITSNGW